MEISRGGNKEGKLTQKKHKKADIISELVLSLRFLQYKCQYELCDTGTVFKFNSK
jgi:hypothetical protein